MATKNVVLEGKTKHIHPLDVLVEAKNFVTWGNKHSAEMSGKGEMSTRTMVAMFRLLEANGRRAVFQGQTSATMYRARFSHMILLEVVVRFRNEELGSLHKRRPDLPLGLLPKPLVEFYLKSSGEEFGGVKLPGDDPLITSWNDEGVFVHPAGKSVEGDGLFVPFAAEGWSSALSDLFSLLAREALIDATIVRKGWLAVKWDMGDVKLEYGFVISHNNGDAIATLYLAEAPSNDEWRIRDPKGIERSKQNIRNGKPVKDAIEDYFLVARAAEMIRFSKVHK